VDGLYRVFRLAMVLTPLLGLAGAAGAQEWKKIEPTDSALIVAIPALKEAKPTYFDRAEGQAAPTTDKAGYASSGTLGVFWYEFFEGPVMWRDEGLRSVVEGLDWIADKKLVMNPKEQAYFRGNAEGRFTTLTYRPQNADRPCVVGQYARSGSRLAERVTLIVCQPAGTQMDMAGAKKLIDGVGTKTLPPAM
jgi:hypothetical protein